MPKKFIFFSILLFLAFFAKVSFAADQTATSCLAADIQSAINAVANGGGGTVTLPACDGTSLDPVVQNGAQWVTGDKICISSNDLLRFIGQGQAQTIISYTTGTVASYNWVACPGAGNGATQAPFSITGIGVKEVANFTIDGNSIMGGIYWLQCMGATAAEKRACVTGQSGIRLHHVTLRNLGGHGMYFCQNWRGVTLFDHLTIANTANKGYLYGILILGGWGPESYEVPPAFGINNGLFVEDSIFNGLYHPIAGGYASRVTARHNTFQNSVGATTAMSGVEAHGAGFTWGCGYGDPVEFNGAYRYEIYNNKWTAGVGVYVRGGFWLITDNDFGTTAKISSLPESGNFAPARPNCTIAAACPWDYIGYTTSQSCFQTPRVWAWNNSNSNFSLQTAFECDRVGTDTNMAEYLTRAPQTGDKYYAGGTYTKFTYPHPLQTGGSPSDTTPPAPPTGVVVS